MALLVFSYSHEDEDLRNSLEKHLTPLKRMGKIDTWHDRCILAGDEFEGKIDSNFARADIILLLVSSDFIASNYCYEIEMANALERHERGEAIVIPVILRPCAWHDLPFGKLLAATKDGKPIVQFPSYDEGFAEVANAVSAALKKLSPHTTAHPSPIRPVTRTRPLDASFTIDSSKQSPRSSNLSIPRRITDLDLDRACREGFSYLARFFENSLDEIKKRNLGLEVDFHSRDADSFTSSIYEHGARVCHCGIWRGSKFSSRDIYYSQSGVTEGSYNASMSISDDGQLIGFRSLMGSYYTTGRCDNHLLTNEGMAEEFWAMFIQPLKTKHG